jgi:4-amino-4-deoxy-L-arabinose transferase-like glycosyltransferase
VQLTLVALAGLVLRVVAVLTWSRQFDPVGDQVFYWRQGQDLAQGFGFVFRNNYGERIPTAAHPPLYSAYLGLVGLGHFASDSHAPFRLASTLLGFITVILVGLVGRRIAGNRAGLIAAGLAAIYPNLWLNDVMLVSESMYALTIAGVLLCAYRYRDDRSTTNAMVLGAVVALAALARAEAAVLAVVLIVPLVLWDHAHAWRERFVRLGAALAVSAAVVAPWVVRNYVTFSTHPITLSNGTGFVLEIANCDQTYGLAPPAGEPADQADKFLGYWAQDCDRTPWPPGDETVAAAAKQRTGVDYITSHESRVPMVVAARIGRMWDLWRPAQSYQFNTFFERRGADSTVAAMVMYYPLLVAGIAALVVLWRRRITIIPFVALALTTTVTAAISFGITRYRVGADVGLTVLGGVAVDAALRWWSARRTGAPAGAGTEPAPDQPGQPETVGAGA